MIWVQFDRIDVCGQANEYLSPTDLESGGRKARAAAERFDCHMQSGQRVCEGFARQPFRPTAGPSHKERNRVLRIKVNLATVGRVLAAMRTVAVRSTAGEE